MPFNPAWIPVIGSALSFIFGGDEKDETRTEYDYALPEEQRNQLSQQAFDVYQSLLERYGDGGNGEGRTPVGSPFHATGFGASPGLVDMSDVAYEPNMPASYREGVYGRLKSGALAQAADTERVIKDAARLSGKGNAPYVQDLIMKARNEATREATRGLGAIYDNWFASSLGRRDVALRSNASNITSANIATAGNMTGASETNARLDQSADQFDMQNDRLDINRMDNMLEFLTKPLSGTGTTTRTTKQPVVDRIIGAGGSIIEQIRELKKQERAKTTPPYNPKGSIEYDPLPPTAQTRPQMPKNDDWSVKEGWL